MVLRFKEWLEKKDSLEAEKSSNIKEVKEVKSAEDGKDSDMRKLILDDRINVNPRISFKKLRESIDEYLYKSHVSATKAK